MLLRMRDFLTVKVGSEQIKRVLECNDSKTRQDLLVRMDATHAGLVNGNARFYRPDLTAKGAHTWVPSNGSPLPVLHHHDKKGVVFGRVVEAKYIDLSYKYTGTHPKLKDTIFYGTGPKRMGLFDSVNFVERNLATLDGFDGLGKIELGVKITHPEAIEKLNRDEFLNVSSGFVTDCAYCSVCHTDWAKDGKCEHSDFLGRTVEGKRVFLITGNQRYEEVSFVNFPADPFARVLNKEAVTTIVDSLTNRVFFYGLSSERQNEILQMTDAAWSIGSDIEIVSEDEVTDHMKTLDEILDEIRGADLTQERAAEIKLLLDDHVADDADTKKLLKRVRTSLTIVTRKNSWDLSAEPVLTKEAVQDSISNLDTVLSTLDSENQKLHLEKIEMQAAIFGLELPKQAAAEVQTDEAPVPAVPEQPQVSLEYITDEAILTFMTDAASGKGFADCLGTLSTCYASVEEADRWMARDALRMLVEHWSAGETVEYYKKRLSADPEAKDMIVSRADNQDMEDAIQAGETKIASITDSLQALLKSNEALVREQKKTLAQAIVIYSVAAGEKGYQGMDSAQIQSEIAAKSNKSLISLSDAMEEVLQKKLPGFVQEAASQMKPAEVTEQVPDSAQVQDNAQSAETPVTEVQDSDSRFIGTFRFPVRDRKAVMEYKRQAATRRLRPVK